MNAEIGEIASNVKKGRESEDEMTTFRYVGNAAQDMTAADMVIKNSKRIEL